MITSDNQFLQGIYNNVSTRAMNTFEENVLVFYEELKHNEKRWRSNIPEINEYFTKNYAVLKYIKRGWYGAISDSHFDTGIISKNATSIIREANTLINPKRRNDMLKDNLTRDHIFAPKKFAQFFLYHINEYSLEEFLNISAIFCLTMTVTKDENTELTIQTKKGVPVLQLYESANITVYDLTVGHRDVGLSPRLLECLPREIIEFDLKLKENMLREKKLKKEVDIL